jgi:predicted SAM-dependent methyltransferase
MKLHLGCGGVYLEGYVNIDVEPEDQGIQEDIRPDQYGKIEDLRYERESIDEVRLHHVFEHFARPTALRLLIDWHQWLRPGGALTIETPDFERCARWFFLRPTARSRERVLRHMFGSHEAAWAVHWDGWYRSKFERVLTRLGYSDLSFERARWHGTYNITVHARKPQTLDRAELERRAEELLRLSLVDDAASEHAMLEVWAQELRRSPAAAPPG